MPSPDELKNKFLRALDSERTVMLGLAGVDDGHTRPMTAMIEDGRPPMWFFTSTDTELVSALRNGPGRAIATFASKGHKIFACVHGSLNLNTDRAVVERLWNPFVAAWYEGGKDDPKLALLRLDPEEAEIWENENSLVAGLKLLLGKDPQEEYRDKVANVRL